MSTLRGVFAHLQEKTLTLRGENEHWQKNMSTLRGVFAHLQEKVSTLRGVFEGSVHELRDCCTKFWKMSTLRG